MIIILTTCCSTVRVICRDLIVAGKNSEFKTLVEIGIISKPLYCAAIKSFYYSTHTGTRSVCSRRSLAKMSNLTRTPPAAGHIKTTATKRPRSENEMNVNTTNTLSLDSAVQMLMNQFAETKAMIDDLRSDLHSKIETVKLELDNKLESVSQDIHTLRAECATKFSTHDSAMNTLNERVDRISSAVDKFENRNELIISGIPYMNGEDLCAYFRAICKQIDIGESAVPIVDVRRMKSRALKDGDESLVVVQFALKNACDNFYGAYLRRRNLQLNHIGVNSTRRIYVNENLAVSARKVKAAALRMKKAGKFSSVFTKHGTVYVKATMDGPTVAVHSEEQLDGNS